MAKHYRIYQKLVSHFYTVHKVPVMLPMITFT